MTDHNPSRPCGHIHPDTGWPDLTYCTRAKNHAGPHYSMLKKLTWGGDEMSYQMSVALARRLADGKIHNFHAGLAIPAARTIVAQSEQIERLQAALQEMMIDLQYAERIVHDIEHPMREWREPGGVDYGLLPDDMEPPA